MAHKQGKLRALGGLDRTAGQASPNAASAVSVHYLMLAGSLVAGRQRAHLLLAAEDPWGEGRDLTFLRAKIATTVRC